MAKLSSGWWLNPPVMLRYGAALGSIAAALVIEWQLEGRLVGAPVALFLCAVMLSAWFGGFRPGLFAAAMAVAAFYYMASPGHSFVVDFNEIPRIVIFGLSVLVVGLLSAAQRRATVSLRRARDELDETNQELKRTNEALRVENAEHRRAEEALRENQQRFRDFAETGSDWLWETGPDHRFVQISEHLRTVGIKSLARVGQRRWDFAGDREEDPEKWRTHIAVHEAHQPFRDFLYPIVSTDGSTIYIRTSGKPVFDAEGRFIGYRGVGSDVTAEVKGREAEKALRQAQAELARVTCATTLGELTASIVHEVNQPLAAIVTNGEVCLRFLNRPLPDLPEVTNAVGSMISDGRRAREIVGRIHALCRKAEPQMVRLDINGVIDEVLLLIQREVTAHGVVLRRTLAPSLRPVLGDRVELQQVIINLVINGMEAMATVADRPRELSIRTSQSQDVIVVEVRDCGIGIDPANADLLFNSFYTTKSGGMGMGLSICRSIVDAHGGRLWASPNTGPGACFQFFLPAYQETKS